MNIDPELYNIIEKSKNKELSTLDLSEKRILLSAYKKVKKETVSKIKYLSVLLSLVFILTLYIIVDTPNLFTYIFFFSSNLYMFYIMRELIWENKLYTYMIESIKSEM